LTEFREYLEKQCMSCFSNLHCPEGAICVNEVCEPDYESWAIEIQKKYPVLSLKSIDILLRHGNKRIN